MPSPPSSLIALIPSFLPPPPPSSSSSLVYRSLWRLFSVSSSPFPPSSLSGHCPPLPPLVPRQNATNQGRKSRLIFLLAVPNFLSWSVFHPRYPRFPEGRLFLNLDEIGFVAFDGRVRWSIHGGTERRQWQFSLNLTPSFSFFFLLLSSLFLSVFPQPLPLRGKTCSNSSESCRCSVFCLVIE